MELVIGKDNQTLRQKSLSVKKMDADLHALISQMQKTMKENDGIGLAAIQIGVPLRVIVCEVNDKMYSLINPEIVKLSSETSTFEEGCLSLPGIYGEVERPEKVTVKATNLDGKKVKIKAFDLLARVVQHEIDHLDGILFIDKASNIREDKRQTTAL